MSYKDVFDWKRELRKTPLSAQISGFSFHSIFCGGGSYQSRHAGTQDVWRPVGEDKIKSFVEYRQLYSVPWLGCTIRTLNGHNACFYRLGLISSAVVVVV